MLVAVGVVTGALAGLLLRFWIAPDGSLLAYALAAVGGAVLVGVASPVTGGRVVSFLFLPAVAGSPLRKVSDYSAAGALLAMVGAIAIASSLMKGIVMRADGWRLYAAVLAPIAGCVLAFFPLKRLPSKTIFPLGCATFALGMYAFIVS